MALYLEEDDKIMRAYIFIDFDIAFENYKWEMNIYTSACGMAILL